MENHNSDISHILQEELQVNIGGDDNASKDDLVAAIAVRVLEYLDTDIELLFSYLYRLDILEHKIQYVINHQTQVPTHVGLAELIYDRQMDRVKTKKEIKQDPIEGWDEW